MSADPGDPPGARSRGVWYRAAAAVVAGVGVLVASNMISWHDGYSVAADARPMTDAETGAECHRLSAGLQHGFAGVPAQRLEVERGDSTLRVYVSEADDWISVCRSGTAGVDLTFGTVMESGPADSIRLFGDGDAVVKANVLVGQLPAGATTVRARLASGRVVTGTDDGGIFVVWDPTDSVRSARVTAYGPGGSVVAEATASDGS
ncbi:hypothetical protein [Jidongwangia harbinensis]|uniref:hypothetical protein n=1 Tax=Jidongwangia harbinensis TaxID=2878561 RepID=UPI001CDA1904|nr:hypothetical protein [Jidongwangia harbinensis]MCA2211568.1 hypothetical protein [Jidongwangia harbinensis]